MSSSSTSQGSQARAVDRPASAALQRLQRGEITLDQYLEERVDQAVAHVRSALSGEQMQILKETIREALAEDPVLVELVRRATGLTPVSKSE